MRAAPMLVAMLLVGLALPAGAQEGRWDFAVTLDDRPIGTHRFVVESEAGMRTVDSRAQFDVRLLGIPFYRYRHHAQEQWQGDCLRVLRSETDDDGKPLRVDKRFDAGADEAKPCLMAFAYWNPKLVMANRLVDPQTGETVDVRFERLPGETSMPVGGQTEAAVGWRLSTARQQTITLWYAANGGRWIALDASVKGGRMLHYRLTPP